MAKAGRPKGWSPKTGWSKTGTRDQAHERRVEALAQIEAICCLQVERIQQHFYARYGADYTKQSACSPDRIMAPNHNYLMPQNDFCTPMMLKHHGTLEIRK